MKVRANSKTHSAIVAEASTWFIEFRAGDVTGDSRTQFIEWLRRSPEHIQAYLDISRLWAELPASDAAGKFDLNALIDDARRSADVISLSPTHSHAPATFPALRPKTRWQRRGVELAAAATVIIAVMGLWLWRGTQTPDSYATGIGEQRTIQLADGSTIELNSQSSVQVRLAQDRRDVSTARRPGSVPRGQGPFHAPSWSAAGDAEVRAVGTASTSTGNRVPPSSRWSKAGCQTHDESGSPPILLSAETIDRHPAYDRLAPCAPTPRWRPPGCKSIWCSRKLRSPMSRSNSIVIAASLLVISTTMRCSW